jgi:hypothetical protein
MTAHPVTARPQHTTRRGRPARTPLAPPTEPVEHIPTAALLSALISASWHATRIGVATATLRHSRAEQPIRVTMAESDTSRLHEVFIGDRQVSFRAAIEYAQAQR